jgi:hypothetical protein
MKGEHMVKLGTYVVDRVTGFAGTAVSRTEYLYGCVRIGVQPHKVNADGKVAEIDYFDEQRLDAGSPAKAGGPQESPRGLPNPR